MIPLAAAPTVPLIDTRPARTGSGGTVAAVLAAVLGTVAVVLSYVLAVLDPTGRAIDDGVFRDAISLGLRREALGLLEIVGIPSVALATVVLAGVAIARGDRVRAAVVVALVLGAQLTTQVLKAGLVRPGDDNSLPSGHVTLVASLGVALVLVVPRLLRPLAALAAVAVTAIAGVATMLAGWHRPSDIVAALGVVAVTTGVLTLVAALLPGRRRPRSG